MTKSENKTVLIVDDEKWLAETSARALKKAGIQVVLARSYDEAVKALEEQEIDLCITDVVMEGKSGVELFKKIREGEKTKDLPVIIQSGFTAQIQQDVLQYHPIRVFQKPYNLEDLVWTVKDALGLN